MSSLSGATCNYKSIKGWNGVVFAMCSGRTTIAVSVADASVTACASVRPVDCMSRLITAYRVVLGLQATSYGGTSRA